MNHISTDVSRIDFAAGLFHMGWTGPIQLVICLILLLINIGPSALAGFGLFFVVVPIQSRLIYKLFRLRQLAMTWTDKRAKLLQELLTGIKVIKFFAWEEPYLDRLQGIRSHEVKFVLIVFVFVYGVDKVVARNVRSLILYRAGITSVASSLPVLASVISFIIYGTTHQLNAATIFASLSLFNILRMPLMALRKLCYSFLFGLLIIIL